jgi:hypothetical protein
MEASVSDKSVRRLRHHVLQSDLMLLAGFAFQACSLNDLPTASQVRKPAVRQNRLLNAVKTRVQILSRSVLPASV